MIEGTRAAGPEEAFGSLLVASIGIIADYMLLLAAGMVGTVSGLFILVAMAWYLIQSAASSFKNGAAERA